MPSPKLAAAVALVVVIAFVGGSVVRLATMSEEAAPLVSLAVLATVAVFVVSTGAVARRRDTRYW